MTNVDEDIQFVWERPYTKQGATLLGRLGSLSLGSSGSYDYNCNCAVYGIVCDRQVLEMLCSGLLASSGCRLVFHSRVQEVVPGIRGILVAYRESNLLTAQV